MLVRFFGRNFRSLKREFELSMVAADLTRKEDRGRGVVELQIRGVDEPLRVLRSVAIYGPNASGKSTVLDAARALRWLGTDSSQRSKPDADIPPYEPFLLDEESETSPIRLGCDVYFQQAILRYEIEYERKAILHEQMTILEGDSEIKLIDRRPSGEVLGDVIERSDANRLYVRGMQPNVSVLSKLAQHGPRDGDESVHPYYITIRNAMQYADYSASAANIELGGRDNDRFADEAEYRDWIMKHLIRAADVGICDVITRREKLEVPDVVRETFAKLNSELKFPEQTVVVSFVHQGKRKQPIDYSDESSGTKKLFNIAADWWRLANNPVCIFADELSASLHPRLLDRLIRAVNEAHSKRTTSQLVFATHDTGLLEAQDGLPPAVRRDQVYFTKKDAKGESDLYSLAEFKDTARPVHNLRRRYLSGLYSAIPNLEKLSL
jgi:AAA15 family ATPase/GTPase